MKKIKEFDDRYRKFKAKRDKKKVSPQNPHYYSHFKIEPIDFINANEIPYMEGNVIKYICRYPYKGDPINDLIKARTYLNKIIARETKKRGGGKNVKE